MVFLIVLLFSLAGCKTPRPRTEIPEPVGKDTYLVYDGTKLIWRTLVGGPSGSIDASSHPGEIEIVNEALAKYLHAPIMTTPEPGAGQLVEFVGPPSSAQAVKASGLNAAYLGIDNGVLRAAVTPASSTGGKLVFGWTGDQTLSANGTWYATFGSKPLGANATAIAFPMPLSGRFTRLLVYTRTRQPATGPLVVSFSIAGVPLKGIALTLEASAEAGLYSASGEVAVNENDLIQIRLANNAAVGAAAVVAMATVFEF